MLPPHTTSRLAYLMHEADLEAELQAAVVKAHRALTDAEQAHRTSSNPTTAQALVVAEHNYEIALANRNNLSPKGE